MMFTDKLQIIMADGFLLRSRSHLLSPIHHSSKHIALHLMALASSCLTLSVYLYVVTFLYLIA